MASSGEGTHGTNTSKFSQASSHHWFSVASRLLIGWLGQLAGYTGKDLLLNFSLHTWPIDLFLKVP